MEALWQDIRYGIRAFVKTPGFTLVVILTLALGIGANTAIFSVVNTVLLTPLPYDDPDTIVRVWLNRPGIQRGPSRVPALSTDNFQDWREQTEALEHMAIYRPTTLTLTGFEEPVRLNGAGVSPALFPLLRKTPMLGRVFEPQEEKPGNHRVILLSHALWERRFGSDPEMVGKPLTLDGNPYAVVGVMPPEFQFPDNETEFWVPFSLTPPVRTTNERRVFMVPALARIKDGFSLEQAEAEGNTVLRRVEETDSEVRGAEIELTTLHEQIVGPVRPALFVLLGAVGFVLLIACANVANLLLTRAAARRKELSIRAALGAGRLRLIRQMLAESMLLSLLGGAGGLLLALWGIRMLVGLSPGNIPRLGEIAIDLPVLVFTLGISLLTGLLFGLAPALKSASANLMQSLKEGAGHAGAGFRLFRNNRLRSARAVAEIALALMLLVGAGLLINSFARLISVHPGYDPEGVATVEMSLPRARYPQGEMHINFHDQLLEKIRATAGVQSAGLVNSLPLTNLRVQINIQIEGQPPPTDPAEAPLAGIRLVSTDYFKAMGIRLLRGRTFNEEDRENTAPVLLVNDALVRRYLAGEDPLGQRLRSFGPDAMEIVGVVGDVKPQGLDSEPGPTMYFSYRQMARILSRGGPFANMHLVVRASGDPYKLVPAIRSQVLAIDPEIPLFNVSTMEQRLSNSVAQPRFYAVLLGLFAGLALTLAAVGIYGVLSYHVAQCTHEIGIRMALGAQRNDLLKLVLRQGLTLAAIGIGLGLAGALGLARFLGSLLFGLGAADPVTYLGVSALLAGVAVFAAYVPARRATRVDPMVALRYE